MATVLSLFDGTTTIVLTAPGTGHITTEYAFDSPDVSKSYLEDEPTFTETISIVLKATTKPLLQSAIKSVNAMLVAAIRRKKYQTGPRVYLQFQFDGDANTFRAEIVDGKPFKPNKEFLIMGAANLLAEGELFVTHRIWEGPEVELALSTSAAGAATGGQTIYNHDDGDAGHDNWVQIASGLVTGDIPSPLRIVLTNNSGGNMSYRNFYLAVNALSDPANFVHMVEGEARRAGGGTVTADATSSGGNYDNLSFSTSAIITFDLTAAQMQRTKGRFFRLLARFVGWSGTGLYIKPILRDKNANLDLYVGDEVNLLTGGSSSAIFDLGSLPFPNGGYNIAWDAMTLILSVRATGAGIVNLDYIQLSPLDSYQAIVERGYTLASNDTMTIDNIEGIVYTSASGSSLGSPIYSPRSGPLKVFPNTGLPQRIIVLSDEGSGGSNIAKTLKIQAFYRERRFTV